MIKKSLLTIALLSSLTLQAEDTKTKQTVDTTPVQQSTNKGLLGATYIKAYIGTTKFGDDDTANVMDDNIQYGLKGQFKINDNISLGGGVEMITADIDYNGVTGDASGTALYLEGLYHFIPNGTIDPFVSLGFSHVSTDLDITYQGQTYSKSNSNNGYQFSAGAEFDLTNKIFLTPAFSYSKVGDGDASKDVMAEIDFEVTQNFYLGGKIDVELTETDTSYYVGAGFKF